MGRCRRCGHHEHHCSCKHRHRHRQCSSSSSSSSSSSGSSSCSLGSSSSFKLIKTHNVLVLPQREFGVKHDKHHHSSSSTISSSTVSSYASCNEQIIVGRKKCGKIVRLRRRVKGLGY